MDNTSVAFVITTFNRRELLEKALASVLHQLQVNDRIIILDDFSEDSTEAYAKQLCQDNHQIVYHRMEKNSGVNAARQAAIRVAVELPCEWISYIDDDDTLTADVRAAFNKDHQRDPSLAWIAYPAIDEKGQQLSTTPGVGSYSYIEDYMGKRIVKGDFQHFLRTSIAKQCEFTRQFKNAEVWYFWCQVSALTPMYIGKEAGVSKLFLEEGITQSGFNRDRQLEVAKLKVKALDGKMSPKQFSKLLRNLGKALIKNKQKQEARSQLIQAIRLNPGLVSAYKYLLISLI